MCYSDLRLSLTTQAHSERRLFAGFVSAALIAWKLTVSSVIINAPNPEVAKIHHETVVRYSYFSSHVFIPYQANGIEIAQDRTTRVTKSFESILQRFATEAPNTFRIPISLVRCSATNDASPNNPRQEMRIAKAAKNPATVPIRLSSPNFFANSSSAKVDRNGAVGLCF